MVILLKYECWKVSTLEVKFVRGLIYFIITDEIGNFVHCVFSGDQAREFVKILTNNESAEVLDHGGDLMRFQFFNSGGFGISINSKKMTNGFTINHQQIQELIDFCQKIHKL